MNSKRQTIWLVSMLSLMVVLSAYYLFTEDVNELNVASTGIKTNEIVVNTGQLDGKQQPGAGTPSAGAQPSSEAAKANEKNAAKESGTKTETPLAAKPEQKAGDKTAQPVSKSETNTASEDAKVLRKVQATATSGTDYFINQQLKRNEEWTKKVEQLMTIASDTKQSASDAAKAQEELYKLQDLETKITGLEESLMKDFPQVVIRQEANKWKVTVQAAKLERSQALSIVDKTMQELSLTPDQVSVEMKP